MKDVKNEEVSGMSPSDAACDELKDRRGDYPDKKLEYDGDERRSADRRGSHRRTHDSELIGVIEGLRADLAKKDEEISTLKDVMLRRQADFENYKKRMLKTQDDQKKMTIRDMAGDMIGINDDLLRVLDASQTISEGVSLDEAHKSFIEGVSMISRRIVESLDNYGVSEIESQGKEFDPRLHEAIEFETSSDVKLDTVSKVYLKGFRIDDLVVRTARVRVTKPVSTGCGNGNGSCCSE